MKAKFSKRILSLFLAVMMVVTSIPMFALTASAASEDHFLLAYFTGNGNVANSGGSNDQSIRFAVSTDGQNYQSVNGGNQVIQQYVGTKNARDPYIFKGQDGMYYCLATDADCSIGWWGNSQTMVFWRSSDLVNWKDATVINMAQITGKTVYRCWAPQVIWDGSQYMVYFALAADGYANNATGDNTHMYYCTTTDLLDQSKYSQPQPLVINSSKDNIDGDITYFNGNYYLFYKDETNSTICVIKSDKINEFDANNRVVIKASSSVGNLEGCQVFQNNNGEFIFMADRFSSNGNFAVYNLGTNLDVVISGASSGTYTLPSQVSHNLTTSGVGPRHGSVMKITADQYNALKTATFTTELPPASDSAISAPPVAEGNNGIDLSSNLVARYFVKDTTTDEALGKYALSNAGSGPAWDSSLFNGVGGAYFTADNYSYSNSTAGLLSGTNVSQGFTISFYANTSSSNAANGRFFELNNIGTKGSHIWGTSPTPSYVSMWAQGANMETTYDRETGTYDVNGTAMAANPPSAPSIDTWHQFTVTLSGTTTTVYVDGARSYSYEFNSNSTVFNNIKNGGYLVIGATCWPDDTFTGYMRDFRVYNRAITADEASKLANQYSYDSQSTEAQNLSVLKNLIGIYESKMNGTVYQNMKPAYDMYTNACQAYDAFYYGGNTSVDLVSVATNFRNAIANMKAWSAPVFNATAYHDTSVATGAYSNVAYQNGTAGSSAFVQTSKIKFKLFVPNNLVLVDDGNEIKAPIAVEIQNGDATGKRSTHKQLCYIDFHSSSTIVSDTKNWSLKTNVKWNSWHEPNLNNLSYVSTTNRQGTDVNDLDGGSLANNYLVYNTNGGNTSTYYDKITDFNVTIGAETYWDKKIGQSAGTDGVKTGEYPVTSNQYIINYRPVVTKLNDVLPKFTSAFKGHTITDYQEGGLAAVLTALDSLTSDSVNPMKQSYSTNVESAVQACANAISQVAGMSTPSNATVDNDSYQRLKNAMDEYLANPEGYLNRDVYTSDSIDSYIKIYNNVAKNLFYYVSDYGYSKSDYAKDAATALTNVLNEKLNLSGLRTEISNKDIYDENGNQIYTFQSWLDNVSSYASTYKTLSTKNGRYDTTSTNCYAFDGTTVTYDKVNKSVDNQSTADTAKNELSAKSLTAVDQVGYPSFDAAYTVAKAVDEDKYVADKFADFAKAVATAFANVYTTTTTENADLYNLFTSSNKISSTTLLRTSLTQTNTDNNTSAILTAIDTLNQNIRTLKVNISENVENPSVSSTEYLYGSTFTVALPGGVSVAQGKVVQWVITKYASTEDMTNGSNPISSQVIAKNPDDTIELVANGAFDIQYIVEGGATTATNVYKVYNAYGKVAEIIYSDTALSDAELNTTIKFHPVLPFYTFASWTVGEADENGIVPVTPVFTIDGAYKTISVIGTGVDYSAKDMNESKTAALVGTDATLSKSGVYGWAVKKDGKYQIVGYGDSYTFTVIENEVYTAITTDGSSYFVEDGAVALTKDNVYGFTTPVDSSVVDANAYLNAKLTDKAPFVYYQLTQAVLEQSKQRVYVRITGGSNATSFGLIFTNGVSENRFNSTATNAGGQFYVQMKNTTYEGKSIKAFVNYSFTYQGEAVNTIDYASVK